MRNSERKYPRVKAARQLKPIYTRDPETRPFPMGSRIVLDKKRDVPKKEHQLLWTSGETFGNLGDRCKYISHEELFELQRKGFIELTYA